MTNWLYFDTDCLSAFLWVKEEKILTRLYAGKIIVPQQVYQELSVTVIEHLKKRLDVLINNAGKKTQTRSSFFHGVPLRLQAIIQISQPCLL